MRFKYDHDLHIHSRISPCSGDNEQTAERIFKYAQQNKLKTICITDHFWDDVVGGEGVKFYRGLGYDYLSKIKPLPQSNDIKFLFGCETELSKDMVLGISKERFDSFDFVVIPTTHLHFHGFTISLEDSESASRRAQLWTDRFESVLNMDLPFHKIGIAHLVCNLMAKPNELLTTLQKISLTDAEKLFKKASKLGVGIEINMYDAMNFVGETGEIALKLFQIAKECKCKFYFGSDAHTPKGFLKCTEYFERAIDLLDLDEKDKFVLDI